MRTPLQANGFRPSSRLALGRERRNATFAELVASLGLGLATLVAVTVVSAGIARADVAMSVIDNETGLFAISLIVGLLFAAMGGLTVLSLPGHRHKHRH
jgi:Na+/pantothenate symporter